jgi:hypothetical protein
MLSDLARMEGLWYVGREMIIYLANVTPIIFRRAEGCATHVHANLKVTH